MAVQVNFMKEVNSLTLEIHENELKRKTILEDTKNQNIIKSLIWRMLSIQPDDIESFSMGYSYIEDRVMIDLRLKEDKNARWVFSLEESGEPKLKFREVFNY